MTIDSWWPVLFTIAGAIGLGLTLGALLWHWTEGLAEFDDVRTSACATRRTDPGQILAFDRHRPACNTRPQRRHHHNNEGPGRTA